jgi:glycerol-3-phosphate acyltransferase PlsY
LLLTLLVPLVWARHHENIARLLKGTEPKIGQRTKS